MHFNWIGGIRAEGIKRQARLTDPSYLGVADVCSKWALPFMVLNLT